MDSVDLLADNICKLLVFDIVLNYVVELHSQWTLQESYFRQHCSAGQPYLRSGDTSRSNILGNCDNVQQHQLYVAVVNRHNISAGFIAQGLQHKVEGKASVLN